MRIRFFNGKICTMEQGVEYINGELWTSESWVEYAGAAKQPLGNFDREIDLKGNLLMPGFKNAHTHSAMTFLRSFADDMPLLDWLHKQVFPMEAKLSSEDIYHLSKLAVMEYLTSGITANFDMYMHPREMARASVDCGFRTVSCGSVNSYGGSVEQELADYDYLNNYHELISAQFGFHAEYTCEHALLERISAAANERKLPVYFHNSESRAEVEQCIERTGMTPTAYLDSLGMLEHGGGCFHGVHLTEQDMSVLKEKNIWVVTNPGSNVKLASGIAPVEELRDRGIGLAIGTDGPASNNCLDFFREMFLTTALQKIRCKNAAVMNANIVLQMATTGGALAMGLNDCDTLAVGKKADLIVLDLMQPNMQPINNLMKNVVYSGSKQNVKLTMVNGKILYEDGHFFIGTEPEEVYARANEIINLKR